MQRLGDVEGAPAEFEGFFQVARQQADLAAVAMPQEVREEQVALAGARGQAGARSHARDIPKHSRDFSEVSQAGEFRHQADARTAGAGQRTRPSPARAGDDAGRRQFVFGLHNGDGIFAIFSLTQAAEADDAIDEAGRWRDGIPGYDIDAAEDRPQRAGIVARHHDLALRAIHALKTIRIALDDVLRRPVIRQLDDIVIHFGWLLAAFEVVQQHLINQVQRDIEQLGDSADIGHVLHQLAECRGHGRPPHQLGDGDHIIGDVIALADDAGDFVGGDADAARRQVHHIFGRRIVVVGDHDLGDFLARCIALFAGANGVPGRQSLDVGREEVLAVDRDAHTKERAHQHIVGCLAARAILGRHRKGEVVGYRRELVKLLVDFCLDCHEVYAAICVSLLSQM